MIFLRFLFVYCVIFGFYLITSIDIGNSSFYLHMRRFIPAAMACMLPYLLFKNFNLKNFKTEVLISILWSCTMPLLSYISIKNTIGASLSLPYDVAAGAYLFGLLTLLKYVLLVYNKKIIKWVYHIFVIILFIIPVFNIIYFVIFHNPISSNGIMIIYQTNIQEAIEYLNSINKYLFIIVITILGLFVHLAISEVQQLLSKSNLESNKRKAVILFSLFCIMIYTIPILLPKTMFINLILDTHSYFKQIEKYATERDDILKNIKITRKGDLPRTVVLVIGESATRNYMSAFTEMSDNTTPWLLENKNNSNFIILSNAYSCAWNTVPALEHALTEANYYNQKGFDKSVSIIDIAKNSGYKTYWFSNQGIIGAFDTPITLVANTADVAQWRSQIDYKTTYDIELLNFLKQVDKNENNFIVFHLMGSHIDYNNRYPKEFQIWTDSDVTGRVADYKNSLRYTDFVLKEIFYYCKQNLNLDALIYFSDHGTDPNRSRDPDESKFISLRVPIFVYLSDEYKRENVIPSQSLERNKQEFISNDLLYNLVCGIFNIESNHYEEEESIASPKYKFDINSVKTGLGNKNVKDDPYL